jgi:hypothetical protein
MKKFTSLLIGLSLALAGAAFAQQPEEQATPKTKTQAPEKTERAEPKTPKTRGENVTKPEVTPKTRGGEAKSGANAANPEATIAKQPRGAKNERAGAKANKAETTPKSETSAAKEPNSSTEATASATPGGKQQLTKGMKGANAKTSPSATPATAASASAAPTVAASASAAPSVATTGQQNARATGGVAGKKPDPQQVQQVKQQVQQIKQQHTNFRAQPRPDKVPAVTFNQSYRIQGSEQWQGPQYEVFRSYHPERHDRGWYSSRYNRVELIGGGYYYWNNGYWYPAWGYDPSAEYYAYDAPIYVGHRAEPPDRVIADVQAELQQMGYYTGEVDGLLGPLTREALTAYQADQGLPATAVIDEPTLDSLGMS